jgi:transposase
MKEIELIQIALMFTPLWQIAVCQFEVNRKRLDIHLDFAKKGSRFSCTTSGQTGCAVHDTDQKFWRHPDFYQHEAYLNDRVSRTRCGKYGIGMIVVP